MTAPATLIPGSSSDAGASLAACRDRLRIAAAAERQARGDVFSAVAQALGEGVPAEALAAVAGMKPGRLAGIRRAAPLADEWPASKSHAEPRAAVGAARGRLESLARERERLETERRGQVTDALGRGLLGAHEAASLAGLSVLRVRAFLQHSALQHSAP